MGEGLEPVTADPLLGRDVDHHDAARRGAQPTTPAGSAAARLRTAGHEKSVIPIGFPTTTPSTIAIVADSERRHVSRGPAYPLATPRRIAVMRHRIASPTTAPRARRRSPLDPVLRALPPELRAGACTEVRRCAGHNDVRELRVPGGRSLIVKRARHAWAAPCFRAARLAARLLRRRTGIVAPDHVPAPEVIAGRAIEAYWRLPLPTLRELWPRIPDRMRERTLRSWGELLRRVHSVKLQGHGPLEQDARTAPSLAVFLAGDIGERLAPAAAAAWPRGAALARTLAASVPDLARRVGDRPPVLVHNDLHMGNVLCAEQGRGIRCVGVLDLEWAIAGPPESDLARVQVLHGALFGQPLDGPWFEVVLAGYRDPLDAFALTFYRAYHLLNLGYHAALAGHDGHAAAVRRAVARELAGLRSLDGANALRRVHHSTGVQ
jgi:aminoglycoside phosphotransferase (APT) family kinase protein